MPDIGVIAIGFALSAATFTIVALVVPGSLKVMFSPSSDHSIFPQVLGLIAAWIFSLPLCFLVIEHTQLRELSWGHVGEMLLGPFVLAGAIMFPIFASFISKRNEPQQRSPGRHARH
jgi:hypothetical protein